MDFLSRRLGWRGSEAITAPPPTTDSDINMDPHPANAEAEGCSPQDVKEEERLKENVPYPDVLYQTLCFSMADLERQIKNLLLNTKLSEKFSDGKETKAEDWSRCINDTQAFADQYQDLYSKYLDMAEAHLDEEVYKELLEDVALARKRLPQINQDSVLDKLMPSMPEMFGEKCSQGTQTIKMSATKTSDMKSRIPVALKPMVSLQARRSPQRLPQRPLISTVVQSLGARPKAFVLHFTQGKRKNEFNAYLKNSEPQYKTSLGKPSKIPLRIRFSVIPRKALSLSPEMIGVRAIIKCKSYGHLELQDFSKDFGLVTVTTTSRQKVKELPPMPDAFLEVSSPKIRNVSMSESAPCLPTIREESV